MTDNERAEAAEQARITDWERDREETLRDRVAQTIAQDYARHLSVESAERRADFWLGLAKTDDEDMKRIYKTVAAHYLSAAFQVKHTKPAVDETQQEMPFDGKAA